MRLVNQNPLAAKINYLLEDDTFDLANVRGLEGMTFILICDFSYDPELEIELMLCFSFLQK